METLHEMNQAMQELYMKMQEPDVDPAVLQDTLECLQDAAEEKLASYAYVLANMKDTIKAETALRDIWKEKVEKKTAHIKSMEKNMEWLNKVAAEGMKLLGKDKLEINGVKMGTRTYGTGSVIITDAAAVDEKWLVPQPPKIDKEAIKKHMLETGENMVPGAELALPEKKFTYKF